MQDEARAGGGNKKSSHQGNNRRLSRLSQGITGARAREAVGESQPEGHSGMRGQDLGKCWWAFEGAVSLDKGRV